MGNIVGLLISFIPVIGPILGALVGALLDDSGVTVTIRGPRITDFNTLTSKFGIPLPRGYGAYRFAGNYMWLSDVTELALTTESCQVTGSVFGIGGSDQCTENITYNYYQSMAFVFAEGQNATLLKLWANGELIVDFEDSSLENTNGVIVQNVLVGGLDATIKFYGGNNLNVDPTMAKDLGIENTPQYKDLIYLVIENLHLNPYGNSIPIISASIAYNGTGTDTGTKSCITPVLTTETGSLILSTNEVFSQTATSFEGLDALIPASIVSYPYITTTSFDVPYADIYGRVYSSSLYTGSDSELIQYDRNSGETISRRSLQLLASPLVALTFDYPTARVYGISDSGTFYFRIFADVIRPVITTQVDEYTKLREAISVSGDTAKDIYYKDNIVYALRSNAANPKETYLIIYREINSFEGEVYGPLTHASHTNSFDASTTLEDGDFLAVHNTTVVIGSQAHDWMITVNSDTGVVDLYSTAYTIAARDRSNFITTSGGILSLSSGERINISTLDLVINYDILALFSLGSYDFAMWSDQLHGYIVYDGTQVCSAYIRANTTDQVVDTMLIDIITKTQSEVGPKLTAADLSFSNLASKTVEGYSLTQQSPISQHLDPIKQVFAFDIVESDGKLKSTLRTQTSQATLLDSETAVADSTDGAFGVSIGRTQESEMVKTVTVSYSDKLLDYQQATQAANRISDKAIEVRNIRLDLVATADEMAKVADVLLVDSWLTRENYTITVGRKYFFLDPADIITYTTQSGDLLEFRITRISLSDTGLIELNALSNRAGIYTSGAVGYSGVGVQQVLSGAENIKAQIFDIPYIYANSDDNYSVYAAALTDTAANYNIEITKNSGLQGADSVDSTHIYNNSLDAYGSVVDFKYKGASTTKLYFTNYLDKYDTEIIVQVLNGAVLADITDKETMFLTQENYALIGNELMYYADITALGSGRYSLTGLYRHRQSIDAPTRHAGIGDSFRFIDKDSLMELAIGSAYIDTNIAYRANSTINTGNVSPYVTKAFEANAAKPLPAARVGATMSTDDIVVAWSRRDRVEDNWLSYTVIGLSEVTERYKVEVLDSEGVVVRTTTDLLTPTYTYTSVDQVADFAAAQDTVLFRIYQLSTLGADGFSRDFVHNRNGAYFADFEADTIAVQAPNTTATWTTSSVTYLIVAGKYLQISNTVAGYKALSFDDKHVTLDSRVKMKAKFSGAGASAIVGTYVVLHGTADSGIIAYVTDDLTKIGIAYNNNGTLEDDVTTTIAIQEDIFYNIKIEIREGTVFYKIWKAHLAELADWDLVTRIDSSFIGFAGIGQNSTDLTIDIDHIQIEGI